MFDLSVGHDKAMVKRKPHYFTWDIFYPFFENMQVVGMHSFPYQFYRWLNGRIVPVDPIRLFRPDNFSSRNEPGKTARQTQLLRNFQVSFALTQLFLKINPHLHFTAERAINLFQVLRAVGDPTLEFEI